MKNKTAQDAFEFVAYAQFGSLAEQPSTQYLYEMQRQLYIWIDRVNAELGTATKREALAAEIAELERGHDPEYCAAAEDPDAFTCTCPNRPS